MAGKSFIGHADFCNPGMVALELHLWVYLNLEAHHSLNVGWTDCVRQIMQNLDDAIISTKD